MLVVGPMQNGDGVISSLTESRPWAKSVACDVSTSATWARLAFNRFISGCLFFVFGERKFSLVSDTACRMAPMQDSTQPTKPPFGLWTSELPEHSAWRPIARRRHDQYNQQKQSATEIP